MKTQASCLVIAVSLFASTVFAACEMPSLVASIPDGTTATEQELLAAQAEVQAYISAMDDYIACQNEDMEISGEEASDQFLYRMSERIEAARKEVDAVATEYNDQVTAFRAARQVPAITR